MALYFRSGRLDAARRDGSRIQWCARTVHFPGKQAPRTFPFSVSAGKVVEMIPAARRLTPPAEADTHMHSALIEALSRFTPAARHLGHLDFSAVVGLNDERGNAWTVRFQHGRFLVSRGTADDVAVTISGDPLTLASVIRGHKSGVEAFLLGRLAVRGNLSLALKLDGIFDRRTRKSERPHAHRVTAAGVDTFYLDAGEGPVVILLHGLGATNASMLPTLFALARRYRVIAPDLPGFGDSSKPPGKYDPAFFVAWLTAFLDALDIPSAHIVGNSMGGRIAIEMALVSPHRVEKLGLLAPSMAFRRFRQAAPIVKFLSPEMGAVPLPVMRPYIKGGLRLLFAKPDRLPGTWHDAAVDEFLRIWKTSRGRVSLFSAARQIYLERPFGIRGFWPRLSKLATPSLFIWGDRDHLVPAGFAPHVTAAVPHAHSVVLENCGHVPQFEQPDTTNRLLSEFFG